MAGASESIERDRKRTRVRGGRRVQRARAAAQARNATISSEVRVDPTSPAFIERAKKHARGDVQYRLRTVTRNLTDKAKDKLVSERRKRERVIVYESHDLHAPDRSLALKHRRQKKLEDLKVRLGVKSGRDEKTVRAVARRLRRYRILKEIDTTYAHRNLVRTTQADFDVRTVRQMVLRLLRTVAKNITNLVQYSVPKPIGEFFSRRYGAAGVSGLLRDKKLMENLHEYLMDPYYTGFRSALLDAFSNAFNTVEALKDYRYDDTEGVEKKFGKLLAGIEHWTGVSAGEVSSAVLKSKKELKLEKRQLDEQRKDMSRDEYQRRLKEWQKQKKLTSGKHLNAQERAEREALERGRGKVQEIHALSSRQLKAARILLVMAGVEQNPGPAHKVLNQYDGTSLFPFYVEFDSADNCELKVKKNANDLDRVHPGPGYYFLMEVYSNPKRALHILQALNSVVDAYATEVSDYFITFVDSFLKYDPSADYAKSICSTLTKIRKDPRLFDEWQQSVKPAVFGNIQHPDLSQFEGLIFHSCVTVPKPVARMLDTAKNVETKTTSMAVVAGSDQVAAPATVLSSSESTEVKVDEQTSRALAEERATMCARPQRSSSLGTSPCESRQKDRQSATPSRAASAGSEDEDEPIVINATEEVLPTGFRNEAKERREAKKQLSKQGEKGKRACRADQKMAAVGRALADERGKELGAQDALKEKLDEIREEVEAKDEELREMKEKSLAEVAKLTRVVQLAQERGFVEKDDSRPILVYAFRGKYRRNMECSFEKTDPIVTVNVFANNVWSSDAFGEFMEMEITPAQVRVAATTVSCTDPHRRFTNIYNGLVQAKSVKEEVDGMNTKDAIIHSMTMDMRAFLLTGTIVGAGRARWQNDVPEFVPHLYQVTPPPDADKRLKGKIIWAPNSLKFESNFARKIRAAPIRVQGECANTADAAHRPTLIAGFCKRLFPLLPTRGRWVLRQLHKKAKQFVSVVRTRSQLATSAMRVSGPNADADEAEEFADDYLALKEKLFEEAMEGRPLRERRGITAGFEMARDDPDSAIDYYLRRPYKCFIKLEVYPRGSFKPPRFIMSMDLECRGIQIFFMCNILHMIEEGTRAGNVKGLTEDEKTIKIIQKFSDGFVGETDFSSFESCIGPDLKQVSENYVFKELAYDAGEKRFVEMCLDRETVTVIGPCFTIPEFHHIRMSGDYWTSLGNLLENVVVLAFCLDVDVEWLIDRGLFEGDDGLFPAPDNPQEVLDRSRKAGVLLTFDIAPWQSLSFCGNHFEEVNGESLKFRDKYKAVSNMCTLFNAPGYTRAHDIMLQRSKCLAYLSGCLIPDAFVLAAVIERFTRKHKVDPMKLRNMGLLKEYSCHGLEGCVPDWLVYNADDEPLSDEEFVDVVYRKNFACGGECDRETLAEMVETMRAADLNAAYVELPSPYSAPRDSAWYARDGSVFSHRVDSPKFAWLEFNDLWTPPHKAGLDIEREPGQEVPPDYAENWVRKFRTEDVRRPKPPPPVSLSWLIPLIFSIWICVLPILRGLLCYALNSESWSGEFARTVLSPWDVEQTPDLGYASLVYVLESALVVGSSFAAWALVAKTEWGFARKFASVAIMIFSLWPILLPSLFSLAGVDRVPLRLSDLVLGDAQAVSQSRF